MARIIGIDMNRADIARGVRIQLDDGQALSLSYADAHLIKTRLLLEDLREAIHNILDEEIDDGYIDMDKHEYTREDFEEEVYEDLADEIEYGNYGNLDEDVIRNKIIDTADFYELNPDDDEEEE